MGENQEYYLRHQYTQEFKIKICREHIETGVSIRSLARKYNLSGHSLIYDWLRRYKFVEGESTRSCNFTPVQNKDSMGIPKDKESFDKLRLEKRIEELEKQLKEAEMKAIAYSTMVDIAEKEFQIPIRKKYNTKPLKK